VDDADAKREIGRMERRLHVISSCVQPLLQPPIVCLRIIIIVRTIRHLVRSGSKSGSTPWGQLFVL
jgi:hypothetical protein